MTKCKEEKLWNPDYLKIWVGNFLIHFSFTLIVPLLPLYLNERFGATKDTIGIVLAGYTLTSLVVRPFSGYFVDKYSRRLVLLICNFFFFSVFAGYLVAGSLTLFAIFRTLHGAPFGATTVAASTVAVDVLPSSRRTEGIGYYGLSNNLAMVLGPALAIYILQLFDGDFQMLFWLSLLVSLAGLVLDATIKLPKKEYAQTNGVLSLDRFFLTKGWPESIAMVFLATAYGIVSTYVAIYGKEQLGITSGTGLFFTLFALGLILSRLTGAHALRKNLISRNATVGVLTALCGFGLFAFVQTHWAYYISAFIIGLGNGHMYPAFQNMFINLAEHNRRGTANSSIMTAWEAGIGLGVFFGGQLAENFSYSTAFITAFLIDLTGIVYYLLRVRPHFESNKLR